MIQICIDCGEPFIRKIKSGPDSGRCKNCIAGGCKRCEYCFIFFKRRTHIQKYCSKYCAWLAMYKYLKPPKELICSRCREMKPIFQFHKTKSRPSGHSAFCKSCRGKIESSPQKLSIRRKRELEYRKDPKFRLHYAIKGRLWYVLKDHGNGKSQHSTEELLGYSIDDLMKHLEKQFTDDMSWDNYGEWHIDHIIPVSAFNFKTAKDIDFKRCWAMKNLQPMWGSENSSKYDSLDKPFQPALAFGGHIGENNGKTTIQTDKIKGA